MWMEVILKVLIVIVARLLFFAGGWLGVATEMQPLVGLNPAIQSSFSSSWSHSLLLFIILQFSSASYSSSILFTPHTSLLSLPPSRDTRESSPDSQTVDSSCKTPEPSFPLGGGPWSVQSLVSHTLKVPCQPSRSCCHHRSGAIPSLSPLPVLNFSTR